MITTNRFTLVALILACCWTTTARSQHSTEAEPVRLASRDTDLHRSSVRDRSTPRLAATVAAQGDPYGFAQILNRYRASAGLAPVSYDPSLSAWASQNNAAQCRRGIGHHVNPNCFQNCGWNYQDAPSAALAWMRSPGHRQNMLSPSISRFGIAYGPGPYWTLNAR
jgi:uncharacterized protein YkwD